MILEAIGNANHVYHNLSVHFSSTVKTYRPLGGTFDSDDPDETPANGITNEDDELCVFTKSETTFWQIDQCANKIRTSLVL